MSVVVSDVAEVKEALHELEQFHDGTRDGCMACCRSEFCPEAVSMRAARRWVRMVSESQEVLWCRVHQGNPRDCEHKAAYDEFCDVVPALVAAVGVEKESE